ncbi:hypothetical protein [Xanthobacter sp.]|uniref:hypothetical protein n=1 Tax=Xanthobacter sp. TaxID=35809 RepID=UPI0025CE82BD|nr:hypothetical protein [Xanthobacter sp.]
MAGTDGKGRRAHAFAAEAAEMQVGRLMRGLEVFCEGPAGIARALRATRKAARAGGAGYDPARHAALLRLQRLGQKADCARAPAGAGAQAEAQRPSNSAVER